MTAFIPGLPVYGGLARSKINEYSGSKSLLSGVFLALFTFLAVKYLLHPLAWFPVMTFRLHRVDRQKASLSAVISTVCLGLLIEGPEDLMYYWSMRAWTEIAMICLVIATTVFWVGGPP
jgi:MFS superfamily sulfate permease-like transporter